MGEDAEGAPGTRRRRLRLFLQWQTLVAAVAHPDRPGRSCRHRQRQAQGTSNPPTQGMELKLDEIDWQVLLGIAADCGCEYRGTPSWRRLFDDIASGKLSVVNRPDKRVRDFQAKRKRHP